MPDYTIRDPQSGKTLKVRGASPPTEQELEDRFASSGGDAKPSVMITPKGTLADQFANVPTDEAGKPLDESGQPVSKNPKTGLMDMLRHVAHPGIDPNTGKSEGMMHSILDLLPMVVPSSAGKGEGVVGPVLRDAANAKSITGIPRAVGRGLYERASPWANPLTAEGRDTLSRYGTARRAGMAARAPEMPTTAATAVEDAAPKVAQVGRGAGGSAGADVSASTSVGEPKTPASPFTQVPDVPPRPMSIKPEALSPEQWQDYRRMMGSWELSKLTGTSEEAIRTIHAPGPSRIPYDVELKLMDEEFKRLLGGK